jgi:transcriptional regulator with XRE-family HTH domain
MRPLHDQLREAWLRSDFTQRELAEKLGCAQTSVSKKLAGLQVLSTAEAQQLADILGVTIVWAA